jgi:hypothetical protein
MQFLNQLIMNYQIGQSYPCGYLNFVLTVFESANLLAPNIEKLLH